MVSGNWPVRCGIFGKSGRSLGGPGPRVVDIIRADSDRRDPNDDAADLEGCSFLQKRQIIDRGDQFLDDSLEEVPWPNHAALARITAPAIARDTYCCSD